MFYVINDNQDDSRHTNKIFYLKYTQIQLNYISDYNLVKLLTSPSFNFSETNKYCLYLLYNMNWNDVIQLFHSSEFNITVSGGSNNKRHLLSPTDIRLTTYIIALCGLNASNVISNNDFNNLDKDRYLPFIDFTKKSNINEQDKSSIHVMKIKMIFI